MYKSQTDLLTGRHRTGECECDQPNSVIGAPTIRRSIEKVHEMDNISSIRIRFIPIGPDYEFTQSIY